MTTHNIAVELLLGLGRNSEGIDNWCTTIAMSDIEIDTFGSIWGERQVLSLGSHFNIYCQYKTTPWAIGGQRNLFGDDVLPEAVQVAQRKLPGGSVSGNFGEVLTVLTLQSNVPPRASRALRVSHLCPAPGHTKMKCPDLLVESAPLVQAYNQHRQRFRPYLPDLPDLLPGECKNNNRLGALRQIAAYWQEIGVNSPLFGFGLISSINYCNPPSLTFNLLVPINVGQLDQTLYADRFDVNTLKQKDMQGCLYGF